LPIKWIPTGGLYPENYVPVGTAAGLGYVNAVAFVLDGVSAKRKYKAHFLRNWEVL
jgi:hypothetical protein